MENSQAALVQEVKADVSGDTVPNIDLQPRKDLRRKPFSKEGLLNIETRLFKSPFFLLIFSLAVMNAFLYVYLAVNNFPAVNQKTADALIQESFGEDFVYFSPVNEFLAETQISTELSFPEFKRSLKKLNESINKLGIPAGNVFSRQSFRFSGGGVYWSAPRIEGQTGFKPKIMPDSKKLATTNQ